MNDFDLRNFATHSLDQESRQFVQGQRNSQPEPVSKTACLSKFGVGAKQAGFFLGDRLRVLTLKKQGSASLSDTASTEKSVCEFCLDREEERRKFERTGRTEYKGTC